MSSETGKESKIVPMQPPAQMKNLSAETVDAGIVQMHQSGASKVQADSVEALDSFLGEVHSQNVTLHRGVTAYIKTDQITADQGFSGVISTNDAVINGTVGVTAAQSVRMQGSRSGVILAREVHGAKVHTVFLIANRMDAPVETVVEPRSIALFGAAAGLTFGMVYGIIRWLRSRS
ncbi:MAG: hypothetical protein GYA15_02865 [Leptolinea sp.]|jgi:hypothetical protein|nr:hypothetical protein [Leptolinea sp.]